MRINLYVATVSLLAYTGLTTLVAAESEQPLLDSTNEFAQKYHDDLAQYDDMSDAQLMEMFGEQWDAEDADFAQLEGTEKTVNPKSNKHKVNLTKNHSSCCGDKECGECLSREDVRKET